MTHSKDQLSQFFDDQHDSDRYRALKDQTRELDLAAAERLADLVHGDVLAIGGVWDGFEWTPSIATLTVLDLSVSMLEGYCPDGAERVVADLYVHEFPARQFDTVVFPLVLHHTPSGGWTESEQRVLEAFDRARRWLRPPGRVVVVDYCAQRLWSALQRPALPVTRWVLARAGQPLVIMYGRAFYESALRRSIGEPTSVPISAPGFDYGKWYPVFMGIPWLKVPLSVYPRLHVLWADVDGDSWS